MFEKYGFENENLVIITEYNDNIVIAPQKQSYEYSVYPDFSRSATLINAKNNPLIFSTYMEECRDNIIAILFRKVGETYEINLAVDCGYGLCEISERPPWGEASYVKRGRYDKKIHQLG